MEPKDIKHLLDLLGDHLDGVVSVGGWTSEQQGRFVCVDDIVEGNNPYYCKG